MGPALAHRDGEEVLDAGGAWLIPGLWDAHAHLDLEAARVARLELGRASCAEEVLGIVAVRARALRAGAGAADGPALIQGFGHRLSNWPRVPSVAELDDIPGSRELVESGYRRVLEDMAARGITGVTDMTWGQDSRLDRAPGSHERDRPPAGPAAHPGIDLP
ncbi:hypothetical protein B6G06_05120 [Actinomyces gaoshouyii]|nr:hypothetical protein B6G06_05120 [Actinomyces gaoshouyii]